MTVENPLAPRLERAREGVHAANQSSEAATIAVLDRLELVLRAVSEVEAVARDGAQGEAYLGPLSRLCIAAEEAMELLQAQDIVSQRLSHVTFLLDEALANLGDPGSLEPYAEEAPDDADPEATTSDRVERQSVADDVFG